MAKAPKKPRTVSSTTRMDTSPSIPAASQVASQGLLEALQHELHAHRFELETQNEELRRTQAELAAARDRYIDLYDFAPVGFFTLNGQDEVIEANLTAAELLGEPRGRLLHQGFARFIDPSDAPAWHRFRLQALARDGLQHVELDLRPNGGVMLHGRLDCLRFVAAGTDPVLRIALTDLTQDRHAEMDRHIARSALEAREAEKRHVARELHEELGQRLIALKMELASLQPAMQPVPQEAAQEPAQEAPQQTLPPAFRQATPMMSPEPARISAMLHALDEAVGIVRRIATDLRPMMLDDLGLNAAVDWLARDSARRLGLSVTTRLQEIVPPPGEGASIAMYRLMQETLNLVSRHPNVTEVEVTMSQTDGVLQLMLQDNSGGWPEDTANRKDQQTRMSLRHQARLLGCEFTIDDARGGGRRFTLRLPLSSAKDSAASPFQEPT